MWMMTWQALSVRPSVAEVIDVWDKKSAQTDVVGRCRLTLSNPS